MVRAQIEIRSNRLPALSPALRRRVGEIVQASAFSCEGLAKAHAAVDTGTLRNSIQAEPESETAWIVAPHTDYAIHQEYGTHKMPAHPFMTPAAETVRPLFLGQMQRAVEEIAR